MPVSKFVIGVRLMSLPRNSLKNLGAIWIAASINYRELLMQKDRLLSCFLHPLIVLSAVDIKVSRWN